MRVSLRQVQGLAHLRALAHHDVRQIGEPAPVGLCAICPDADYSSTEVSCNGRSLLGLSYLTVVFPGREAEAVMVRELGQ